MDSVMPAAPVSLVAPVTLAQRVSAALEQVVRRSVSHQVISGLIAFGSCGFVACDEPVDPPARPTPAIAAPEPLSDQAEPEPEPEAPVPEEPALESDEAQLGTIELQPGFLPDPLSRVGTASAGPIDAHLWDDRCDGWIAEHPDAQLEVVRPFAELAIMAASDADTTLVVVLPNGDTLCVDDAEDEDPVLRATLEAGIHRIWVGTKVPDETVRFVLSFSELDATTPAETRPEAASAAPPALH